MSQPRIRANEWSTLRPPEPGEWTPSLRVSVVIPAFRAGKTLPYTLGALAGQSYPSELLEVIVVDDALDDDLRLPDHVPDNTRIVRPVTSWGRANACHAGAMQATGDVLHWLDADMVPVREEVERQLRWHHLLDHAVVLGHKTFVDPREIPSPGDITRAVSEGRLRQQLHGVDQVEHDWVERFWAETDDLVTAGFRAYQVHVGASASVSRELYLACGGMDTALKLGEDIELGYRLQMRGAVFIADRSATCVHLGHSNVMRRKLDVERFNAPHFAQRVPDLRRFRRQRGRSYQVPFLEVVVDAEGSSFEAVAHTVDSVLVGRPADICVLLRGSWGRFHGDERRDPLHDDDLDLRLLHEEYRREGRVRLVDGEVPAAFPAPYRLCLPAGWAPDEPVLSRLLRRVREDDIGLWTIRFPDGQVGRLESTAARARAERLAEPGEDVDTILGQVSGTRSSDATEIGFRSHRAPPTQNDTGAPSLPQHVTHARKLGRRALDTLRSGRRPG